ncbi:meiotic nuclear division protein 1 [Vararia minispora EC-137]|uniref:Meiotic nuclear division protein 1 n=1 Tax=Vararia minispora EC-137 TaxID=1314806 RepID=A0ACB8QK75_9AGAM|nr:meiotic nuclear division protein 1 [Vararia minispora EC-137]
MVRYSPLFFRFSHAGLSSDEKKVKLLEIFHETLKELEKLAPKMKGIVQQSVKDVLQTLVEEELVCTDKIGSSNFFWSFPSQRGVEVKSRLERAERETHELQKRLNETRADIAVEEEKRPRSDTRTAAEERLAAAVREVDALQAEVGAYGACDPAVVEAKRRAVLLAHEAAVRWTENYSSLMGYVRRMDPSLEVGEVQQALGIGDDYEDIC